MPNLIIRIQWDYAIEFVPIAPVCPLNKGLVVETAEYRPDTFRHLTYQAECIDYHHEDQSITTRLRYEIGRNKHLANEDVAWGDSQLTIDLAGGAGRAEWIDNGMHPELNKVCKCIVLNDALIDELSYESISRIARPEQARLRGLLIETYGACAISGETTLAALEATHIIDVQHGGGHGLNNAILLRADLHRLFDAGLLTIHPSGEIELDQSISQDYRGQNFRKSLPQGITDRILLALETRVAGGQNKQ